MTTATATMSKVWTMMAFTSTDAAGILFERKVEERQLTQLYVGHTTLIAASDAADFEAAAAAVNAAERADGYEGDDDPVVLEFSAAGPGDLPDYHADSPQMTRAIVDLVEHACGGLFHYGWYDDLGTWIEDHDAIDQNLNPLDAPGGEDGDWHRRDVVWSLSGPVNSQGRYDTDLGPAWETEDVEAEYYRQAAVAALAHLIAQGTTREGNA